MPRRLAPKDLEALRALLEHLRDVLRGDIHALESSALGSDAPKVAPDSPAEGGSDAFSQEFSLQLLARDEQTLGEIEEAIERIDAGTYGLCEECGVAIPKARLQTVPHARCCVECQRSLEAGS